MNYYRKLRVAKKKAKPGDLMNAMEEKMESAKMEEKEHKSGAEPMDRKSKKRKPKLGSGARFKALKGKLAKKGAKNPGALAAKIGIKKYGQKKMTKMAVAGKKKK